MNGSEGGDKNDAFHRFSMFVKGRKDKSTWQYDKARLKITNELGYKETVFFTRLSQEFLCSGDKD